MKTKYSEHDLHASVEHAEQCASAARTLDDLRRAMSVLLTVRHGLTLAETAKAIGKSPGWVANVRRAFIEGEVTTKNCNHGGRRNQIMAEGEEATFMDEACMRYRQLAQSGWLRAGSDVAREDVQVHRVVRKMLEERTGRQIPQSTAFALMSRVGKRKFSNYSPYAWEKYARNSNQT